MHFATPIVQLALLTTYTQALSLGNLRRADSFTLTDLSRRQQQGTTNGNQQAQLVNQETQANGNGRTFQTQTFNNQGFGQGLQTGLNSTREEATEEAEEKNKPPSLKTISKAYKEIYHKEKENNAITTPAETSELIRVIGQAVGSSSESGDPATVAKAIEIAYQNFKEKNGGATNNNLNNENLANNGLNSNGANAIGNQRNVNFGQEDSNLRQNDDDYTSSSDESSNSDSNFNSDSNRYNEN